MKKTINPVTIILVAAISVFLFSLQSCNAVKNAIPAQAISFTGASADIQILATSDTTAQDTVGQVSFSYNIDSMIKAQTAGVLGYSNIQSVTITNITLTLNNADSSDNFANFTYVSAEFNTNASSSNSIYDIANIQNNPDTYSDSLNLPLLNPNQDLKQYFTSPLQFTYQIIAKLRRATTKTLNCHVAITYNISVKA